MGCSVRVIQQTSWIRRSKTLIKGVALASKPSQFQDLPLVSRESRNEWFPCNPHDTPIVAPRLHTSCSTNPEHPKHHQNTDLRVPQSCFCEVFSTQKLQIMRSLASGSPAQNVEPQVPGAEVECRALCGLPATAAVSAPGAETPSGHQAVCACSRPRSTTCKALKGLYDRKAHYQLVHRVYTNTCT